jgi:hypothetical protein
MAEPQPARPFYDPARIDFILRNWATIRILAETPQSARGLLQPGETREAPRLKRPRGYHGDPLAWADVVADIERAWGALRSEPMDHGSMVRWLIVGYRMGGTNLARIGQLPGLRLRTETVVAEYARAKDEMSATLGFAMGNPELVDCG